MDVFRQFATDEAKENQGVWKDVGDGTRLLVARSGNKAHARLLSRKVEDNQRALDLKNDASDALSDQIMIDVMAETVLLGWEGLQFKGETLSYSKENARKALAVKDFRGFVSRISGDIENYRAAQEEAASGN